MGSDDSHGHDCDAAADDLGSSDAAVDGARVDDGGGEGLSTALPSSIDGMTELRRRAGDGAAKATLAREFGISRETVYQYLRTTQ